MAKKLDMGAILKAKQSQEEARKPKAEPKAPEPAAEDSKGYNPNALANTVADEPKAIASEGRDRMAKIVDIRKINISSQVRGFVAGSDKPITQERIEELAELIQKDSHDCKIKYPIVIDKWEGQDTVWDGETRVRACLYLAEKLNDESIYFQPARYDSETGGKDQFERFLSQASMNGSGKDIDLRTKLALIVEAKNRGYSDNKIAQQLGVNRTTVLRIGKIDTFPEEIQEMIFSGDLPYTGRVLEKALKEAQAVSKPKPETAKAKPETSDYTPGETSTTPTADPANDNQTDVPETKKEAPKPSKEETKAKVKAALKKPETVSVSKESLESLVALVCLLADKQGVEVDQPDYGSKAELKKFADNAQELINNIEKS
ncbi:hypothetical protein [Reinekea blandensis]|uniref:ParB/Sulfiredoxin domain-containing protein n=1 Tax=Reinekea blandensis MED297 TaxID=314283 RepID=A4BJW8_9GAMM|nr:hypothetical protein [Reinekea blandensis]EAR07569.1 hypothetical protein MED297_00070 [Reinekea sp. MED297] [Reinekea blandensis MED297]